ncbi:DUF2637 domain-containing protein [Streptosporangiaceae bacterium NEAU-GS5]|nr:DUF2637 domain-containing protein [Streptosporangiaceae bacterium NEAU-GS5]
MSTIVIVAIVGTAISSWHAYELIHGAGEPPMVAAGYPALIDGVIFMASMVMLWCSRRRVRPPLLAWLALAFGALVTLAVNVAHGWQAGNLSALVSAIPPLAVIGSYELLMRLLRMAAADTSRAADSSDAGHPDADRPEMAEDSAAAPPPPLTLADAVLAAYPEHGSVRATARAFGVPRSRVEKILRDDGQTITEPADETPADDQLADDAEAA